MSNTLFGCENFSARERVRGAAPPNVNLGPHHTSEPIRAGKLKFYIHLGRVKYSFWGVKIFARGRPRGAAPHSVNSGPPHISETVRARNLRFYAHLDIVRYTFRV